MQQCMARMNGYRPQGYRNRLIIPRLLFPDRRALAEQGQSSRGGPDDRAPVYHFPRDQPSFVRILPHRKPGAGCAPGIHHFFIRSFAYRQPLEKIENQGFHCVVGQSIPFYERPDRRNVLWNRADCRGGNYRSYVRVETGAAGRARRDLRCAECRLRGQLGGSRDAGAGRGD